MTGQEVVTIRCSMESDLFLDQLAWYPQNYLQSSEHDLDLPQVPLPEVKHWITRTEHSKNITIHMPMHSRMSSYNLWSTLQKHVSQQNQALMEHKKPTLHRARIHTALTFHQHDKYISPHVQQQKM